MHWFSPYAIVVCVCLSVYVCAAFVDLRKTVEIEMSFLLNYAE